MASRDDAQALRDLARLVEADLATVDTEDLIRSAKEAEQVYAIAPLISGKVIAELHRRGLSWSEIVRLTGIRQTTAHRRAEPFMDE